MKIDNIYIAQLGISTKVQYKGNLEDYYFGTGIYRKVRYNYIKYVIVKKSNFSDEIAIDLNTKKEYLCGTPMGIGKLFLPQAKMLPFECVYPDVPRKLSKRKILKMGNEAIKVINKKIEEQENNK